MVSSTSVATWRTLGRPNATPPCRPLQPPRADHPHASVPLWAPASATRWCGAAYVTCDVTRSPGRGRVVGVQEVHEPAVSRCGRTSMVAASLRPSPTRNQDLHVAPNEPLVLLPEISSTRPTGRSYLSAPHRRAPGRVVGGRCSRSRGVLEGERPGEPGGAHHVESRRLEVGLGLPGETHDDVRRDGRLRHHGPYRSGFKESIGAVTASHSTEHTIASLIAVACAAAA